MTDKLFAVVRSDLSPQAKACQAAHALRQYAQVYPYVEARWWHDSNTLVLLEHAELDKLEEQAKERGLTCVRFVEPDWDPEGTLTALALGPDAKKFLSKLKLAYST